MVGVVEIYVFFCWFWSVGFFFRVGCFKVSKIVFFSVGFYKIMKFMNSFYFIWFFFNEVFRGFVV